MNPPTPCRWTQHDASRREASHPRPIDPCLAKLGDACVEPLAFPFTFRVNWVPPVKARRLAARGVPPPVRRFAGFTLMEMLMVIVIIGILAALIINLAPLAAQRNIEGGARALITDVEAAIERYKEDKGFYPPDNPNDVTRPQLYYELKGTRRVDDTGTLFESPDGTLQFRSADINLEFGVDGFVNSVEDPVKRGKDYYTNLKDSNIARGSGDWKYIVIRAKGPGGNADFNTVRYNVYNPRESDPDNNPRHNATTYDLWVEVVVGDKTVTIGNWE